MKTSIVVKDRDEFVAHWTACGGTEGSLRLAEENAQRIAERQKENQAQLDSLQQPEENQLKTPTLAEMTQSFAKSMSGWAKAGFALASDEEKDKRLGICKSCDYWKEGKYGRCLKCGCSGLKLWLKHEKCPIGKWGPIEPE